MSKELFIASSPHETKVAVVEDDSLVEVFYQRDTDVGLVGGIYKGRVSRVLPGMQSAFVDIGLERDAFLYVSDFFEDSDEYDRVVADAESRVSKLTATEPQPVEAAVPAAPSESATPEPEATAPPEEPDAEQPAAQASLAPVAGATQTESSAPPATPAPPPTEVRSSQPPSRPWQDSPGGKGRRRRRGRGRFGRQSFRDREQERRPAPQSSEAPSTGFEVLPGESLAKYGQVHTEAATAATAALELEAPSDLSEDRPEQEVTASATVAESEDDVTAGVSPAEEAGAQDEDFESASYQATAAGGKVETGVESESEGVEEDLLAGNFRVTPLAAEPDAPTHSPAPAIVDAEKEPAAEAGPEAEAQEGTTALAPTEEPEALAEEPPSLSPDEAPGAPEEAEVEEMEAEDPEADLMLETEDSAGPTESSFEEALREFPEDAAQPAEDAEAGEVPKPPAGGGTEAPGERSYTIREQHQRPRFAPRRGRRGRGRFGNRGPRQEGHRRPDFPRSGNEQPVQINEVLKEGQEILVQIAKEPLGTKGARITSHIALPGRYLVYMPTIHHIGVSRKIGTEEERLRLRNIILEHRGSLMGGIIVRTAAAGRSEEELKGDLDFLARLWNEIRTRTVRSKAPALIHRDLTLVERILRDILSPDFKSVRVDNELEYQNVLDFVHRFQPSLVGHVKLYSKDNPLFDEFGIQTEIDKALKPKVWLKSGGYIVINQTEALVAIDVNTGKYVGKTNRLEDTIVKTNIDAVKEIVRQVRLRDLGGIVVIDFIDMDDRRNRAKVVQALEEALRRDRAPTKILSFNEFGLVALTRKRVKQSLERTLSEQCPYCTGSGWIKSVTTVCYEIMEEAKKMAGEIEGNTLTLRVNPEVARALKSREGMLTSELESITGKDVVIKSDPAVHHERFEIF